jgi:hypothetical protein
LPHRLAAELAKLTVVLVAFGFVCWPQLRSNFWLGYRYFVDLMALAVKLALVLA